ncbi:MAG: hypothetical protein RLZZ221_342 [Verrucomicrobiota bacterium]|jgi:hypothetical protein
MSLRTIRRFIMTLGLFAICSGNAHADRFLIEPELGVRSYGSDAGDLLDPGATFGGTFGYFLSPSLALVASGSFGSHSANSEAILLINDGASLQGGLGIRLYPLASSEGPFGLFMGGQLGRTGVAWDWTDEAEVVFGVADVDGIGAWSLMGEGGLTARLSSNVHLGGGLRYTLNTYDDETTEGLAADFKGNALSFFGVLSIRL